MPKIKASVPGKIMLAGEYAVLSGHRALAMSVGRYLDVTVEKGASAYTVSSSIWPGKIYDLDHAPEDLRASPLFQTASWARSQMNLPAFHLDVRSGIRIEDGIGSSSALRLGMLLALHAFNRQGEDKNPLDISPKEQWKLAKAAWQLQLASQKKASGYDIATQLMGGLTSMKPQLSASNWPGAMSSKEGSDQLANEAKRWIVVMRGGKGAPTKDVMGRTLAWLDQHELHASLSKYSEKAVDAFMEFFQSDMQKGFGELIGAVKNLRKIFESSPDFPATVDKALKSLAGIDNHWTYKTTGAGGEDALLIIGHPDCLRAPVETLEKLGWSRLDAPLMVEGARLSFVEDT